MTMKFFRFLHGLYEPALMCSSLAQPVLLYALYHAQCGGRGDSICFDAAFDDVSGVKEGLERAFQGDARGHRWCHEL